MHRYLYFALQMSVDDLLVQSIEKIAKYLVKCLLHNYREHHLFFSFSLKTFILMYLETREYALLAQTLTLKISWE